MEKYKFSLNHFIEYTASTGAARRRIIANQQKPNRLLIPWYQLAKSSTKKYLDDVSDLGIIEVANDKLNNRIQTGSKRQLTDRIVSKEALNRFLSFNISMILKQYHYTSIIIPKGEAKIKFGGLEISLSPDLIFYFKLGDKKVYG